MAAPPAENSEKCRSLTMPRARIPEGGAASDASSASLSCEVSDRRDADILTQALATRSEEYRLLFRLPADEVLLQDFNCAFQENILLQGHMYLFVHHICFYSNIFGFETKKTIPFQEVTCVRKAKTVAIFPNAIEIVAGPKKYFFGSFISRDEAYRLIIDGWIQHGGDIRPMDVKSDANSQDNSNVGYEKVQGSRTSADDSSTSNRSKDANVLKEFKPPPNGKVDDMSVKFSEVKENGFAEKSKESPSENPLSWVVEDIDAPTVPEYFTIVAESKFPLLVKDFFSLFVSDSAADFLKDFHGRCGDKDFQCTSWRRHEQFGYTRNISFLHPVKIYLGAKYGSCQEVQKFRVYRNSHLVIETSQQIHDVPYGDYFEVEGIWDVVQDNNGENSCVVKVYSNVAFSRKTMFRGKIEQSTKEECREVNATWMNIAHEIVKEKNDVQLEGFLEQNTCSVQENGNEFGSPPELEASRESPTTNSTNLTRSVHEIRSSNPVVEKNMREKSTNMTPVVTILGGSWRTLLSYVKGQRLLPSVLAVTFIIFIIMQLSVILLLTRVPEVHLVTRGNYISEVGTYNLENIEWLEKRFNYLKEEMRMMESRLERMRHEYALLKYHIQSLERLKAHS